MKRPTRTLHLRAQTVRILTGPELALARGGAPKDPDTTDTATSTVITVCTDPWPTPPPPPPPE